MTSPYCATLKLFNPLGLMMLRHGEKFSRTESRDWPVKLRLGLGLGLVTSPVDHYQKRLIITAGEGLG